jgi:hypothetical protein
MDPLSLVYNPDHRPVLAHHAELLKAAEQARLAGEVHRGQPSRSWQLAWPRLDFSHLVLFEKMKQEFPMFDAYSQCSAHARSVAASHAETPATWPEMVRQSQAEDLETHGARVFSENPLAVFADRLLAAFRRWQAQLSPRSSRQAWTHRHYLPAKRHSPAHR